MDRDITPGEGTIDWAGAHQPVLDEDALILRTKHLLNQALDKVIDAWPVPARASLATPTPAWGHAAALSLCITALPHIPDEATTKLVEHLGLALAEADDDVRLWRGIALDAMNTARGLRAENLELRERQSAERQAARLQRVAA